MSDNTEQRAALKRMEEAAGVSFHTSPEPEAGTAGPSDPIRARAEHMAKTLGIRLPNPTKEN